MNSSVRGTSSTPATTSHHLDRGCHSLELKGTFRDVRKALIQWITLDMSFMACPLPYDLCDATPCIPHDEGTLFATPASIYNLHTIDSGCTLCIRSNVLGITTRFPLACLLVCPHNCTPANNRRIGRNTCFPAVIFVCTTTNGNTDPANNAFMVKLDRDNAWKSLVWIVFLAAIVYWGSWRGLVPHSASVTSATARSSLNFSTEAFLDPRLSTLGVLRGELTGYDTDNDRQMAPNGDQLDANDLILRPKLLPNQKMLTGILPVSSASLAVLEHTLDPLLDPTAIALRDIILLSPAHLRSRVSEVLLRVLAKHVGQDHPEISIKTWDILANGDPESPSVLRVLNHATSSWALVMDYGGLQQLDEETRTRLVGEIVDWRLPYGPKGSPLDSSDFPSVGTRQWTHISRLRPVLASRLEPPFVLPLDLLSSKPLPQTWRGLSEQIALCNAWNASGLLLGPQILSAGGSDALPGATTEAVVGPTTDEVNILRFDILLSGSQEVQDLSPLLCGLLSRGHTIRILVIDTSLKFSFNPIKRKTRLVTGIHGCDLQFFTINQYMRRRQLLKTVGEDTSDDQASHVVITLKSHSFADFLIESFWLDGNILIELPRDDLPFCDWMASLSLQEWHSAFDSSPIH